MDKAKRIFALIGVVVLVGLFATTLFLAVSGSSYTFDVLMVSIALCAIIPTAIWFYRWIFKVMKKRRDDNLGDHFNDK